MCLLTKIYYKLVNETDVNVLNPPKDGMATSQRPNSSAAAPQNRICQFKLVLLGESAVGKSSLVLRFVKGQFHEYQESTIGGRGLFISVIYRFMNIN